MAITVGDSIPVSEYQVKIEGAVAFYQTDAYFAESKVVMFTLPGAFTPTCTKKHLPGYLDHYEALKQKGVDKIACLSVNDAHVMKAWGDDLEIEGRIDLLADPHGTFTQQLGLLKDHGKMLGKRARRSALIAENGIITHFFIEKKGGYELSTAEHILEQL
jgi:peroxiredoxin